MPPRKTDAVVLKTYAYGESSCIMHLFSQECGSLSGIAKGIRRKRGAPVPERGNVINAVAHMKPHRDLHLLADVSLTQVFPETRSDLCKTALRDAGFEVVLKSIRLSEPHPQVFSLLVGFLEHLEDQPRADCFPFALWHFLARFTGLLGFSLDLETCTSCGRPLAGQGGGELNYARGGFSCEPCSGRGKRFLPAPVLSYIAGQSRSAATMKTAVSTGAMKEITRTLVEYCSYHFDIHSEYHALRFLEEMLGYERTAASTGVGNAPLDTQGVVYETLRSGQNRDERGSPLQARGGGLGD